MGCSLSVVLLGWQLGAGGHAAATASATSQPESAPQKRNQSGHAPLSWAAPAAPPEMGTSIAAQVPNPTLEHYKPAADARKDAVITEDQIIPVDPTQPANWMLSGGQYVSVQGYVPATDGRGPTLDVLLTPAAAGGSATTQSGSQTSTATATNATTAPPPAESQRTNGLTYEEQLFRSKWGWAAYAAAQRAANWQQ